MISPGLLTASTNKADHLGMSTVRVACLPMIGAPFASAFLVWGLKTVFPPRRDVGTRVGARTHTRGAKRSGALGRFAESCAGGLSWHNRPVEGETKIDCSA